MPVQRAEGRQASALRPTALLPSWVEAPLASVLVKQGATWVLCTVSAEERVPAWRSGHGRGWLTASYSLLPGATPVWSPRERNGAGGRTREIERLIGRSLRAALDLDRLGERTLHLDCDVLQADGGTRTAAVTGSWLAMALATRELCQAGQLAEDPLVEQVAAISVGMVDGQARLDLDYSEDVRAETDMNVVMTADGRYVEVQGTAERSCFARADLDDLLDLAAAGIAELAAAQTEVLHGG
ncbi:MAG: ribonuclease PH [Caldilineae bacterium]|nr:ribonuclease PH [Chloroflexota bacterium]MCB9176449.1 ribonuclease PH [Caldilineae bacterium]